MELKKNLLRKIAVIYCALALLMLAFALASGVARAQTTVAPFNVDWANFVNGLKINGSYGTSGYVLTSTGTGSAWAPGFSGIGTIIYASQIPGVTPGVTVVPGSSASSTTDSAGPINTAIAAGNIDLEVDSGFALSTPLVLASNTTIHCTSPQYGFIMQASANAPVLENAHLNAPTTSSGTGGYLVSNITDSNIRVIGCTVNANATEAVTGTNSRGTAHGATPGGQFVYATNFVGVNGLLLENNEIYDSGAFAEFFSNDEYVRNVANYTHQPSPTVAYKFTDAVHFIGPDQYIWNQSNRLNAGDDTIAYNADDGNRTGSGDPNAGYVASYVKWGPITHVHDDNNFLDNTYFGLRLYDATELIDDVEVTNLHGTACGNTGTFAALSALGNGNIGTVRINGWNLPTSGSCNIYSFPYNFDITANYQDILIDGLQDTNPGVNWPILTHDVASPGILSERDWDLNTNASSISNVNVFSGGSAPQLSLSGLSWLDSGPGSVFSGSAVPSTLSCSGYNGPNRLLASGFAPGIENGDCFTNTYPSTTTYVNTTFSEASSGTLLAGTTPATCTNGCTGNWTAASGGPSSGQWAYSGNSATLSGICTAGGPDIFCPVYIDAGVSNYTLRVDVSQFDNGVIPGLAFVVRWTNNSNFVTFLESSAGTWGLFDVVSGTTTEIRSGSLGTATGTWTVIMNGTSATLENPAGTPLTGTISGSNTTSNVGLSSNLVTAPSSPDIVTSFSVKSN